MPADSRIPSLSSIKLSAVSEYPVLYSGILKNDNFGYFVQTGPEEVIAVDVPDGGGMLSVLKRKNWRMSALLLTHAHSDHVVELDLLLEKTGCMFCFPEGAFDSGRGRPLRGGETLRLNGLDVRVLNTSGHSPLDLTYWIPETELCFCGDSLFSLGCGRMFSGPAETFWKSLCRIRELPGSTRVCCGHDYHEDNLSFLRQYLPGLAERLPEDLKGDMPLSLEEQKAWNPFLKSDQPEVAVEVNRDSRNPPEVFKTLRELRNHL